MAHVFNRGALGLTNGTIAWSSDTMKARLSSTSESSINKDATSMTGLGLAATDTTLASKTGPVEDTANDRVDYSCGNISFVAARPARKSTKLLFSNSSPTMPVQRRLRW